MSLFYNFIKFYKKKKKHLQLLRIQFDAIKRNGKYSCVERRFDYGAWLRIM